MTEAPFTAHDYTALPRSRADALAIGAPTFFSGLSCKRGHVAPRRTLNRVCVHCDREHSAEQRKAPQWLEYKKLWDALNPGKRLEYSRAAKSRIKAKLAPERAAKRAARIAEREATAEARLEARRIYQRQYRAKNLEKVRAAYRAIRLKRLEHYRAISRTRMVIKQAQKRASKAGGKGSFSRNDVEQLLVRQRGKCAHSWCRKSIMKERHIDHVVPLVLGGTNDKRNLQLLCVFCNLSKGGKHPIEVAQRHGRLL